MQVLTVCRQAEYRRWLLASRLTQTANKRRERATPAETDKQKQEKLIKWRRKMGADTAQTANGRDENLSA